jgi:hypothetical protein
MRAHDQRYPSEAIVGLSVLPGLEVLTLALLYQVTKGA